MAEEPKEDPHKKYKGFTELRQTYNTTIESIGDTLERKVSEGLEAKLKDGNASTEGLGALIYDTTRTAIYEGLKLDPNMDIPEIDEMYVKAAAGGDKAELERRYARKNNIPKEDIKRKAKAIGSMVSRRSQRAFDNAYNIRVSRQLSDDDVDGIKGYMKTLLEEMGIDNSIVDREVVNLSTAREKYVTIAPQYLAFREQLKSMREQVEEALS